MAAHAATVEGHDVTIFSRKEKSPLGGAQYLHKPIEGITDEAPELEIRYVKLGDGETYAHKVYGFQETESSFDYSAAGRHEAWSLSRAYDRLWGIYEPKIIDSVLDYGNTAALVRSFPLTVSSVPAPAICENNHTFRYQGVYLCEGSEVPTNTVLYSGRWSEPWYRQSNIGGEAWTEFSTFSMKRDDLNAVGWPDEQIRKGHKPTFTDCDCHPKLLRVGRFGKWKRGVLTHHAWEETLRACSVEHTLEGIG